MTDAVPVAEKGDFFRRRRTVGASAGPLYARLLPMALCYAIAVIAALVVVNVPGATDYVGADNDDVMRLVTVRDLLAGQSWFDLTQYRLGLAGGTLMHWSRLIDLPIAALVSLFRLYLEGTQAEAAALLVWPLLLVIPLFVAMGLAGRRMGGTAVMHVSLGLTAIFVLTTNRFLPGAIDHHNVQLVLVACIAAMLIDTAGAKANFAIAGLMVALAIAIGAETTPFVAIVALVVAVRWAWHGAAFAPAARAFSLALAGAITAAFVTTVPPHLYAMVTCDSLSIGFYGLATIGSGLLLASTYVGVPLGRQARFGILAGNAVVIAASARILAPQCLGNPLGNLDPLLISLWLDHVTEARSFLAMVRIDQGAVGGYYAAGVLAIAVCVFRIVRRDDVERHAILLSLITVSFLVALVQVRGAAFANLLSILPLSLLIIDLRRIAHADPDDMGAGAVYFLMVIISVPAVWALGGSLASSGATGLFERARETHLASRGECESRAALAPLAALPKSVVAAPSELGVHLLRYTPHRVLSAPYHRNEGGMLTELHIGLAKPEEAAAFLRGAEVGYLAFCPDDPQTKIVAKTKADGLYAALKQGRVPIYLEPLPGGETGLQLYKVLSVKE
ncbi:hypothetical protein MRS76_21675 [Rhizobiaceae bacterium n13]|uniref:Uncharacterized protein n=1 Tax=Ferirhizobium litorale TaxID=2927786 RepID=A0AAE3QGR9_9HYPH|nr:hypothetical protein [Fererhizobium litorale]MDI7864549.1 hypothetical protein [Fererhizobium litorale]MDI7924910.1 hypothetical protein [Fererhizobium litorale]